MSFGWQNRLRLAYWIDKDFCVDSTIYNRNLKKEGINMSQIIGVIVMAAIAFALVPTQAPVPARERVRNNDK